MNKREKELQQAYLNNEKAVLEKLEENYEDALAEINSKIELLMARQDADMKHVIYQVEYQKALKTQVQSILETLQGNEFETISDYLTKSYEDGFIGTMYNLQGQGIPLVFPIDQEQVVAAIQHETKLSEPLYTALGKDVVDLRKKIAGEISRGISSGQMYSEIARNISSWALIPKNNAMRIARTEAHRIQCKASMNACYKAKEKGADVVKQWDAALDSKTRDTHRELDGQIRELDEPFEVAGMKAMMPGGFNRPEEDINCRCALLQRARWALGNDYTKWSEDAPVVISDDGTTQFTIIEAKNYEDFHKQYAKAVEKMEENGIINTEQQQPNSVENAIGVKVGESIALDDAAIGANPNYKQGREYQVNCQRCVQTYEFRRRGYDVVAMPKPSTNNTISWGSECFIKHGVSASSAYTFNLTEAAIRKIVENSPDGSRFSIYVRWKGRNSGAHVFVAEKENGVVRYLDPQSGKTNAESHFSRGKKGCFGIFRMDDKPITTDESIIQATVKGEEK